MFIKRNFGYKFLFAFILSTVLFTVGCGSPSGEVNVDVNHDGSQVNLNVGQILIVTLESNPTTGYLWEVTEIKDAILRQEGEAEYKAESNLVGGGGVEIFQFKALASGDGVLKFVYRRPWEEGVEPLEEFSIDVKVKKSPEK